MPHDIEHEPIQAPTTKTLPVTVVIPVRNEFDSIDGLISGIRDQSAHPAAIVVVDAGSTDGTRDALKRWVLDWPIISVIEVDHAYPGVGRNIGSEAAPTDWIVYIDGGTIPRRGWLEALWEGIQSHDCVAGYGFYKPLLGSRTARWFALAVLPGAIPTGDGLMRNHFIACSIVRKTAWKTVGGFPPWRAAEDRIFMQAINQFGSFVAIPDAVIDWIGPQSWRQVWKRTCLLAEHGARGGRAKDWHWPTLRYWAAGLLCVALTPSWIGGILLSIAWLMRTGRRIRRHGHEPELQKTSPIDWLACAALLLIVDIAMYVGWWRSIWHDDPVLGAAADTVHHHARPPGQTDNARRSPQDSNHTQGKAP
jgi:glycosyltransferase involved in cell wall biosynthesis